MMNTANRGANMMPKKTFAGYDTATTTTTRLTNEDAATGTVVYKSLIHDDAATGTVTSRAAEIFHFVLEEMSTNLFTRDAATGTVRYPNQTSGDASTGTVIYASKAADMIRTSLGDTIPVILNDDAASGTVIYLSSVGAATYTAVF